MRDWQDSKPDYCYNDNGQHVRTTDYDSSGKLIFDIHYEYNALGQVSGWYVLNSEGIRFKRFEVDYNSQGLEAETRQYGADDVLEVRWVKNYDASGNEISEVIQDADG